MTTCSYKLVVETNYACDVVIASKSSLYSSTLVK
jgi:hypothetical protein